MGNINKNIAIILLLTLMSILFAKEDYFQQFVQYKMDVKLDIKKHTIGGKSIIEYTNNSPDELNKIYMHLYPNAFQEGSVKHREYTQRFGGHGRAEKFVKGNESTQSYIQIHSFQIQRNGEILSDTSYIDDTILSSNLNQPLKQGESLTIELNWTHHVGEQVERAGRVGAQYNFAQWYPKLVVYDENGWHNVPFHASGEFYGEFGNFDVNIDVPIWYIVGASGVVTDGNPGWKSVTVDTSANFNEWLEEFQNNKVEIDSTVRRTVSFHAENVHDFAWITSPTFLYEYGSWNGIDVHVLFNEKNGEKWTKKVRARSERALEWLSTKFGDYPYPQVTTTDRLKGGGMEYPMLVMNGSEREGLIVHEIGHIWFYGILGNNEMDEAWIDEGFTTFQTREYLMNRYGPHGFDLDASDKYEEIRKKYGTFDSFLDRYQWSAIRYQTSGHDEPISRKSYMFNHRGSYRYNAYTKPSLMLGELKYILGDSLFYSAMQEYYSRWKLKHPNEKRFITIMEEVSGESLDWFFNPWLHNTRLLDYGIKKWKKDKQSDGTWRVEVIIEKLGTREMPQLLEIEMKDGSSERIWWKNHQWKKIDTISFTVLNEPRKIVLDPDGQTLDADRRNNYSGKMSKKWSFPWLNSHYNPRDRYFSQWSPTLYYHDLDGITPGLWYSKKYGQWEKIVTQLNYGVKSSRLYWSLHVRKKPVHRFQDKSFSYYAYSLHGVNGYGAEIETNLIDRFKYINPHNTSVGFYVINAHDSTLTNLYDLGQVAVAYSKLSFSFKKLSFLMDISAAPGGVSYWSFTRFTTTVKWNFTKNKFGIRDRFIAGFMSSNSRGVPEQERFTIEGAGSGDLFVNPYLRDESSLFGLTDLQTHYHVPGDANLRGYVGEELTGVENILTNSIEFFYTPMKKPFHVELALFIDDGFVMGSKYEEGDKGFNGDYLLDAGIGFRMWKNVFGKKLYFRIDVPLLLNDVSKSKNELRFINDKWLFSFAGGM